MILKQGFVLTKWDNGNIMDISDKIWNTFHPMFKGFERTELGILNFAFSASKP